MGSNVDQTARRLSDDDGGKRARRSRVLTWLGVTAVVAATVIAELWRRSPPSPLVLALVVLALALLVGLSLASGREIVDAVWLDGDALRVEKGGHVYRIARNQIAAIDEPYRNDWTPQSSPRPIRVRLRGRSAIGASVLFVPNRRADVEALDAWLHGDP